MKRFFYILLFLTSGLHAQQLFPLLDSASIAEVKDGRRDARFRLVKNGTDPLRDVRLFDLLSGCQRYYALSDSGSIRLSCDTIKGDDIIIRPGGGTSLVWQSDTTFMITSVLGDTVKLTAGTGINVTGTYPNYTIAIKNTGVTAGTYGSAWKSNVITFNNKGQATAASEANIEDNQRLSLLSGGGTLKLTRNIGGTLQASDFVQLRDSSITNEGKLSVTSISTTKSAIKSNTATSSAAVLKMIGGLSTSVNNDTISIDATAVGGTITAGTGISVTGTKPNYTVGLSNSGVSAGTYGSKWKSNIITFDATGRATSATIDSIEDNQRLTLLAGGGTLKLTRNVGGVAKPSDFVQLKDSLDTNEGKLSVQNISATKSAIKSNTSTSGAAVLKMVGGLSTSVSNDTINIDATAVGGTLTAGTGVNITGTKPNYTIGLANSGVSAGTYGSAWKSNIITVDALGRVTFASQENIADSQDLTLLSGGGTLRLTKKIGGVDIASSWVQLKDSSEVNEGVLSALTISTTKSAIKSNTKNSPAVTLKMAGGLQTSVSADTILIDASGIGGGGDTVHINAGSGISVSGAHPNFTVSNTGDLYSTNEGFLQVFGINSKKSALQSNTQGSPIITFKVTGGMTTSTSLDTIIFNPPSTAVKEAKKKDRLGIIVDVDSIGFDYKKLPKMATSDTLGWYPYFDSLTATNRKLDIRRITYKPFIDLTFSSTKDISCKINVDSTARFDSWGWSNLFTYSYATGKAKYIGKEDVIMKVDAGLNFKWTTGGVSETVVTLKQYPAGGGSTTLGQAYVEPSTALYWQNVDVSRIVYVKPGDQFAVLIKGDNDRTVRTRGYMNIVLVDLYKGL